MPRSSRPALTGAGGSGAGGKVTPRKGTPRKGTPRKKEKSSRDKEKVDLASAALSAVADRQEELAQEYDKVCGSVSTFSRDAIFSSTFSSKLGEALHAKLAEQGTTSSKDFFERLVTSHDGKVSRVDFRQTVRELGLMDETAAYTAKDADADALFAEAAGYTPKEVEIAIVAQVELDGEVELELSEITRALKKLSLRAAQVQQARGIHTACTYNARS